MGEPMSVQDSDSFLELLIATVEILQRSWVQQNSQFGAPRATQTQGAYILGLRPKTKRIIETLVCRIFLFLWSVGPLKLHASLAVSTR